MGTLNIYNLSKLNQELINKNTDVNFNNKKSNESLSTNIYCDSNSIDKERKKFNEVEKNKMDISSIDIEQNKTTNLNNDNSCENIYKFYQNPISNEYEDSEYALNEIVYFDKNSYIEIDEEKEKEERTLKINKNFLKDQYASHLKSKNDVLINYNNNLSDSCKKGIHTYSQQTMACDSQENLLDMYQNNYVNSQQTLKYDSEQKLSYFFKNNSSTNSKPKIYESEKNVYNCQQIPFNINSKHLNHPYNNSAFNEYEKNLINEDEKDLDIKNESKEIFKNGKDNNMDYQSEYNNSDVCKQNSFNEYGQTVPNIYSTNTPDAYEKNLKEQCLSDVNNTYEKRRNEKYNKNVLNSYRQNFPDIGTTNLGNISKNNIYNNQIANRSNNDQLYFNNKLNENFYHNNYVNMQQNNSFLPKSNIQNSIQKPFISNNIRYNLNEQKNESVNGFMTIRTLNMNPNNKIIKENKLNGIKDLHHALPASPQTDVYNNSNNNINKQNFKNRNSYIINIKGLGNMHDPFYENMVPYEMNTVNNTTVNELKNSSTMLQNISNKNSNFENNQQYVSGKQYLNKYLDNHYRMEEIKSCIPEPTLYTKQSFDVPQIIQGLTTKHNNGIVSECNHNTIIEYDNKWRLVSGKNFSINQNDNFKSEDPSEDFQKYLDKKNDNTKKILINSSFNSLRGTFVINPAYDENQNFMKKVYDYKDTLHAYPSYYSIPRNSEQYANVTEKNISKETVEEKKTLEKNENDGYNNKNDKITKKKTMVKKQNLALCGDYMLKHRIKDFVSNKMKDYFNINLFNHYI